MTPAPSARERADLPLEGMEIGTLLNRLNAITDSLLASGTSDSAPSQIVLRELNDFVPLVSSGQLPNGVVSRIFDTVCRVLHAAVSPPHAQSSRINDAADLNAAASHLNNPATRAALLAWVPLLAQLLRSAELRAQKQHAEESAKAEISGAAASLRRRGTRNSIKRARIANDDDGDDDLANKQTSTRNTSGSNAGISSLRATRRIMATSIELQNWDWEEIRVRTLKIFLSVLRLPLANVFSRMERETLVTAITSAVTELLQNKERASWKLANVRQLILDIYTLGFKLHNYDPVSSLMRILRFFTTLSEVVADVLLVVSSRCNTSIVLFGFLRELIKSDFADAVYAKSAATLLKRIAFYASPRLLHACLALLHDLSDSSEYSVRSAVLVCFGRALQNCIDAQTLEHRRITNANDKPNGDSTCGKALFRRASSDALLTDNAEDEADAIMPPLADLENPINENDANNIRSQDDESSEDTKSITLEQAKTEGPSLLEALLLRFRDVSVFVRRKVLQITDDLFQLKYFYSCYPDEWLKLCSLTAGRLMDRNQPVRAAAIRAFSASLSNNPFTLHSEGLVLAPVAANLDSLTKELEACGQTMMEIVRKMKRIRAGRAETSNSSNETEEEDLDIEIEGNIQTTENIDSRFGELEQEFAREQQRCDALEHATKYCTHVCDFLKTMKQAMSSLLQLLCSKNKTEVIDTIEFFVIAKQMNVEGSSEGVSHMWHLVYNVRNPDHAKDIHNKLLQAFKLLYIDDRGAETVVKDLVTMTFGMTLADRTCIERILALCAQQKCISERALGLLWTLFSTSNPEIPISQRRGAALVLSWIAGPSILPQGDENLPGSEDSGNGFEGGLYSLGLNVSAKIKVVQRVLAAGLRAKPDFTLLTYACRILQALHNNSTRLPVNLELFTILKSLVLRANEIPESPNNLQNEHSSPDSVGKNAQREPEDWYMFAQAAIQTIYQMALQPLHIIDPIVIGLAPKSSSQRARSPISSRNAAPPVSRVTVGNLCRFLFVLGRVAIQQIVYMEQVDAIRKKQKSSKQAQDAQNQKPGTDQAHDQQANNNLQPNSKRKPPKRGESSESITDAADELEQVAGTAEEIEPDVMATLREHDLLQGERNLLSIYLPFVERLARETKNRVVKTFAVTCIAQFMCVSKGYCEQTLPLFDELLANPDPQMEVMNANMMVALGDLIVSWSSVTADYAHHLYGALAENIPTSVKKNALMVLLHLILNGMVKVKGQLSHLALCLVDKDPRISGLTRMFFSELANKDSALEKNFGDVLSHLMASDQPEETVKRVLHELFAFLYHVPPRDRFFDALLEKLCVRLRDASSEDTRLWRYIMLCLSLMPTDSSATSIAAAANTAARGFKGTTNAPVPASAQAQAQAQTQQAAQPTQHHASIAEARIRKLLDWFTGFGEKLQDEIVLGSLNEFISRAEKVIGQDKPVIQELREKIKSVTQ